MSYSIPDPRWEDPNLLLPGVKPTGSVVINTEHHLARGLMLCIPMIQQSTPRDIVNNRLLSDVNASPTMLIGSKGIAAETRGNNKKFSYDDFGKIYTSGSLLWFGEVFGSANSDGALGGLQYSDNAATSPYTSIEFKRAGTSNFSLLTGSGGSQVDTGVSGADTGVYCLVGTADGTTDITYKNGSFYASNGSANALSQVASSTAFIGQDYTLGSRDGDSHCFLMMAWDRALLATEVESISHDPYQFLIPA